MKHFVRVIAWTALLSAPGCATIVSGRHAEVTFHSNVPSANVIVRDKHGEQVAIAQTETKVPLKRNVNYIFPARYTATFVAPGYQPVDVPIRSTVNPWVLGNVVFGGIVGLGVDSATGAVWKPTSTAYHQALSPLHPAGGPQYSMSVPPPAAGDVVRASIDSPEYISAAAGSSESPR